MITWFTAHQTEILVALLALSEILALIPGIKSNSIFQLIVNFLVKQKPVDAPKA